MNANCDIILPSKQKKKNNNNEIYRNLRNARNIYIYMFVYIQMKSSLYNLAGNKSEYSATGIE